MADMTKDRQKKSFRFSEVKHLSVELGSAECYVLPADGEPRVDVEGTPEFLDDFEAHCEEGRLEVRSSLRHQGAGIAVQLTKAALGLRSSRREPSTVRVYVPPNIHGDIQIHGGGDAYVRLPMETLIANVYGSGDIHAQEAQELRVHVSGSGDVTVDAVGRWADLSVHGSGDIVLVSGDLRWLRADIHGSGDIKAGVRCGEAELNIHGSGDIAVDEVQGEVQRKVHGSGSIVVHRERADD